MKTKLLRLRYIIYRLAEDASANGTLADRRKVADEGYALIDAEIGEEPAAPVPESEADKVEATAKPHQSPAEIKTTKMLAEMEGPKEPEPEHADEDSAKTPGSKGKKPAGK